MKKKTFNIVLILCLAILLSACNTKNNEKTTPKNETKETFNENKETLTELTPISVSHHPYIHGLPSIIAERDGIYEKYGLKPDITMYAGGAAQNEACATNAWQVGTTGMAGGVLGYLGYDFKIIGASSYEGTVDLWVRKDSPLANISGQIKDYPEVKGNTDLWKGKTVICQNASNCHLLLLATLETMGLTDKDVNIVDMAVAQSFPAFKAGQGDIVALWSPFGYQAETEGWVKVSSAEAVGLNYYTLIIATEKTIKESPELVQKWLQTYFEGTQVIRENKTEAAQWLYDFSMDEGINTTLENCKKDIELRYFPTLEKEKELMSGTLEKAMLQFAKFMYDRGSIKEEDYNKIQKKEFINTQFVNGLKQ